MSAVLSYLVDLVWGSALVTLLFLGGVYLLLLSKGKALTYFGLGFRLLFGMSEFGHDKGSKGQLSHFKALSNALAATVGLGNIAGVAVAISQGGPGSLFWMWVSGFVGMNTKFFESTLSLLFRDTDANGEIQGGPMYYIPKVFKGKFGIYLGIFFAIVGLIGTQAMFQTNQLAGYLSSEASVPTWLTGFVMATATAIVLFGGLKRIAQVTSTIVPAMCFLYVGACLAVLGSNFDKIPEVFMLIFTEAFSFSAVGGGVGGYAIVHAFKIGIKRGAFSNEAGTGTAPMAHGNAKTSEPVSEGLVAMLGPFIDTVIVCTMTALVILTSIDLSGLSGDVEGVSLTARAFKDSLGNVGVFILGVSIFFFSFSTMIGMANYNEKCWVYLFRDNRFLNRKTFVFVFCTMLFLGAVGSITDVVNFIDLGFGLMAYPNMLAVLVGAPLVIKELRLKLK
ncbi:MAG: alanine/glycine:cation symporter family protein [Bdellovibrionales bacterium]